MSAANETLKALRKKDSVVRNDLMGDPADFYVKLIVHKQKRRFLELVLLGFGAFAFVILDRYMTDGKHWTLMALPLAGVGFLVCLAPPTEGWSYRPWQNHARKYEQHQTERRG